MNVLTRLVIAVSLMFASIVNANVILSVDPATQVFSSKDDVVSVTVMIDDLGDFLPLSLSSFDFDLVYDTDVLSFTGYNLFDSLGDIVAFEASDFSLGEYAPGFVNISELSFLTNFELWDFQPGSFALAELLFDIDASAGGKTTALSLESTVLGDVNGDSINIVGINNASVSVPSPTPLTLIGMALLAMVITKKHHLITLKTE